MTGIDAFISIDGLNVERVGSDPQAVYPKEQDQNEPQDEVVFGEPLGTGSAFRSQHGNQDVDLGP